MGTKLRAGERGAEGDERLRLRIIALSRAEKFDVGSRAEVVAARRRFPKSAPVALAAAEFMVLALSAAYKPGTKVDTTRNEREFRRVLALDPTCGRAWEGLAAALDIAERYVEAARAARKAIRYGDDPDSTALLARIRAQQGRRAESRRLAAKVARSRSMWARDIAREVRGGKWDPGLTRKERIELYGTPRIGLPDREKR